jgi:cobaltochelatase CobS
MSNVETIQLDSEETKENIQQQINAATHKVTTQVTKQVLTTVLDVLEERSNEILAHVNKVAKPREVAIAVKIGDGELRKLKQTAHPNLPEVLSFLSIGLSPLLVGPAGCGKTFLGEQAAEALNINYGHLCFSAGVSETWLFGRQTPKGFVEGEFSRLYKSGGLFLADEMDAADANLLLTINTALANGKMYNPISGENIERHKDFHFVGTANTFGKGGNNVYTGRSRLDAATLDRFSVIEVKYLAEVEDVICPHQELANWLRDCRQMIDKKGSQEVISYRAFDKAYKLHTIGFDKEKIGDILFASFPESTRTLIKGV